MIKAFLKKVGLLSNKDPVIIPRHEHGLSRSNVSENALKVLYRLHQQGYQAYLVGGGVRDVLLGLHPKDFDVVTDARPEEVRAIFRNCRLIGRRFRLAHVYFGRDIVEVATFRGAAQETSVDQLHSDDGMILRDNVYGTLAEDVWRRDFTINAIYYNIADFSLVDYVGGVADLRAKRLRMIGSPQERFREDPVRILRAIRFAGKVHFELSKPLIKAIALSKDRLMNVASARLFEEVIKMFHSGEAVRIYELLKREQLFSMLFPQTAAQLANRSGSAERFLKIVFENTDVRIKSGKSVNPAFVMAALLWEPLCVRADHYIREEKMPLFSARAKAMEDILCRQTKQIGFPKRMAQMAREIWELQIHLARRQPRRVHEMIVDPRFRAAYDFLELREKAGEPITEVVQWWKRYIESDPEVQTILLQKMAAPKKRRSFRKKKRHDDAGLH